MNTDEIALKAAGQIISILDEAVPVAQLKAKIQCIIISSFEKAVGSLEYEQYDGEVYTGNYKFDLSKSFGEEK